MDRTTIIHSYFRQGNYLGIVRYLSTNRQQKYLTLKELEYFFNLVDYDIDAIFSAFEILSGNINFNELLSFAINADQIDLLELILDEYTQANYEPPPSNYVQQARLTRELYDYVIYGSSPLSKDVLELLVDYGAEPNQTEEFWNRLLEENLISPFFETGAIPLFVFTQIYSNQQVYRSVIDKINENLGTNSFLRNSVNAVYQWLQSINHDAEMDELESSDEDSEDDKFMELLDSINSRTVPDTCYLVDFNINSLPVFDYLANEYVTVSTYLAEDRNNIVFVIVNRNYLYEVYSSNVTRLLEKDHLFVECTDIHNRYTQKDVIFDQWYDDPGFHPARMGINVREILKTIQAHRDRGQQIFLLQENQLLRATATIKNVIVNVRRGTNIFGQTVNIVSGTHCGPDTSKYVYNKVLMGNPVYHSNLQVLTESISLLSPDKLCFSFTEVSLKDRRQRQSQQDSERLA